MTPEETDKKIEFILQMQAQFQSNLDNLRISVGELAGVLRDSIKLSDDRFTRLDDRIVKLADAQAAAEGRSAHFDRRMAELAEAGKATDTRLAELAEAQMAADGRSARLEERMAELAEAQKATDERLNALISVVERHITGPDHAARP